MKNFKLAFSLATMPLFVSTSALASTDCSELNWKNLGQDAALHGQNIADAFKKQSDQCSSITRKPEQMDQFKAGYTIGLTQFCTQDFLDAFVSYGGLYQDTCPASFKEKLRPAFVKNELMTSIKQKKSTTVMIDAVDLSTGRFSVSTDFVADEKISMGLSTISTQKTVNGNLISMNSAGINFTFGLKKLTESGPMFRAAFTYGTASDLTRRNDGTIFELSLAYRLVAESGLFVAVGPKVLFTSIESGELNSIPNSDHFSGTFALGLAF